MSLDQISAKVFYLVPKLQTAVSQSGEQVPAKPVTTTTGPLEPLSKEDIDFMFDEAMDRQPGG